MKGSRPVVFLEGMSDFQSLFHSAEPILELRDRERAADCHPASGLRYSIRTKDHCEVMRLNWSILGAKPACSHRLCTFVLQRTNPQSVMKTPVAHGKQTKSIQQKTNSTQPYLCELLLAEWRHDL